MNCQSHYWLATRKSYDIEITFVPQTSVILTLELLFQVSFTTTSGNSEGFIVSAVRSLLDVEVLLLLSTFLERRRRLVPDFVNML
jgi:hypothetical protein